MTASPYDIVAYRPAARSEFRATTTNFCTAPPAPVGASLRCRDRRHRRTGGVLLRPDEVHFAPGLVLSHHERHVGLAGLGEEEDLARDDALLQLQPGERGADLLWLERARLGDGGEQRPHRLVGHGVVPLRLDAG